MRSTPKSEHPVAEDLAGWFAGRVPGDWFTEPPTVQRDREEILVLGRLREPDTSGLDDSAVQTARRARIEGFRGDPRAARRRIAGPPLRRGGHSRLRGGSIRPQGCLGRRVWRGAGAVPELERSRDVPSAHAR